MRKTTFVFLLFAVLFFIIRSSLFAQAATNDPDMISAEFDMKRSPQWLKDLRRAEIVAFGSFPLMYLFTNYGIDLARMAGNGWQMPFYDDQNKRFRTIGIAVGGSVLIALIDYTIVLHKRNRQQREIENLPPGTPIIIRKPIYEDENETIPPDLDLQDYPPEAEDF